MFDFIQKFIYFVLSTQDKILGKKAIIADNTSYSNCTSKTAFSEAASLELNCKTNQNREKVKNNIEQIIKKHNAEPEKLIKFIQKSGTNVYITPFSNKITKLIRMEDGFIGAQKGLKAFYLSTCLTIFCKGPKPTLTTDALFLINNSTPENCKFIQQFYKWYSMKFNLPGFDEKSQENFQKYMSTNTDISVKGLSIGEIIGLKEAIARDVEAINFVVELAKNSEGSKKAMKKLTAGGASV